ncbi:MAG: ABC transporter substrate-binding protein [Desulfatiglans sp.]|nr:ABC transporter substrate-binding protein [Thermodesulfobacteriota bacterium]MEE4351542.1 ABC transporter substrate-binding protein [Desulfatiglans sp.]
MRKTVSSWIGILACALILMDLVVPVKADARKLTAGIIVDITGPLAMCGQPLYAGIRHAFLEFNDMKIIPGLEFNLIVYDTKYNAAKTAPGYHYCKSKGAEVIYAIYLQDVEAVKPLAEEDEIPVLGYNSSALSIKLPSWTFCQTPLVEDIARSSIQWIVSNWDYKKEGRLPNIATIGWDNALGNTYVTSAEATALSPDMKNKLNWKGKIIVPPRTVDYVQPARTLNEWETDWLAVGCIPPATIPLMKLRQANNYKYKMLWGDWGQVMWGFVKARAGDAIPGNYWISTFGWWNQPDPGIKRLKTILSKYGNEAETKKLRIDQGVEYFIGVILADALAKAVKASVAEVGLEKMNGKKIYEKLQELQLDNQGMASAMTFTKTKRAGCDFVRVYKMDPDQEPVVVTDWFKLSGE